MVFPNTWRLCILLVLLPGILALCRRRRQENINDEALILLSEMGNPLTLQCSVESKSLQSNTLNLSKLAEGKRAEERISIVNQTLRRISKIYSMNMDLVTWPREKVETFRDLLDGQLRELEQCVRKPGSESHPKRSSAIHKYFKKLRKFLKQKKFSACAWEITRTVTTSYFQQLPRIMA